MLQSGVPSSILPGLPTHLVQELNVGTVCFSNKPRYVKVVLMLVTFLSVLLSLY